MYREIRRAAYHLAEGAKPWSEDFRAVRFPEHWHMGLLELHNYGRTEEERHKTIPTRRLDGVLQTLAPDVIVRPRPRPPVGEGPMPAEDFWMYVPANAPDPLPGGTFGQLLDAWLRTLGPKGVGGDPAFRSQLLGCSAELKRDLPNWEPVPGVDQLGNTPTEGGTAAPQPRQFQLATDALARRILTLDPYPFEGGELRFRALPRGPRDQGAELMSQPLCRTIKRKEWWFSIVLNISLHTTPFDPRSRLHLHWGVRRWATHPRSDTKRLDLSYRQATTVYLRPKIPWLPGAPLTERHALARLRRDRAADAFTWAENDAAGILSRLSVVGHFPDPAQLISEPVAWIGDGPGVRAAVVHSTRMGGHDVGPGLMSHQRSQLTEWAEQALPEGVVRVPDLVRGRGRGIGAPANRPPKPTGDEAKKAQEKKAENLRACLARRTALAAVSRMAKADAEQTELPVVEARLLWQTAEVRRQAIVAFTVALGLDGDGQTSAGHITDEEFDQARPGAPVVLQWRTSELELRLRCLPLVDGLGDRLGLNSEVKAKGARIADAVTARRRALRDWLRADGADMSRPGLALVEIAHRTTFRPSETDPKFAIRLGCADAGVLTQFVVTPSTDRQIKNADSLDHRARSAWLDGLRQLGVRVPPQHTLGDDLPTELQYAALWMVKRRKDGPTRLPKHVPVAVLVSPHPDNPELAVVRGWDDDACSWIPYPDFLLSLVKKAEIDPEAHAEPGLSIPGQRDGTNAGASLVTAKQWRTNLAQQRRETASFLQRMLHSLRGTPTVLITHAQNSRLHWPWLQDGQIIRDLIKPGHAGAGRLDDELRLVRVRGRAGRETAQWWGLAAPGNPNGQPAGFWAEAVDGEEQRSSGDRLFYSTTERPGSFAISPALDRLATRVNASGNLTSQAGTGAWNPTLVEIAVIGCHPGGLGAGQQTQKPDDAEALALAMHQLRQAPDYTTALSLPLPLHLAGLAQAYVLPMFAEGDTTDEQEADDLMNEAPQGELAASAQELDPDLSDVVSLSEEPDLRDQLSLF
ncbi:pPIWI_RE module domain-containing protein [Streptomyces sp. NBC_00658]|uniref:pPIWI_RE module domain-containing protein n=1 Tax=Streptomyces sp. NBC_00658 TaxID=2975800 RepID=UPI0032548CC9